MFVRYAYIFVQFRQFPVLDMCVSPLWLSALLRMLLLPLSMYHCSIHISIMHEMRASLWMVGIGGERGGGRGALSLIYTTGLILNNNSFFPFLRLHTAVQSIFVLHELEAFHCTIGNGGGCARFNTHHGQICNNYKTVLFLPLPHCQIRISLT